MDRLGAALSRHFEDARAVEVTFAGRGAADAHGLVTNLDVQRILVRARIYRHAANTERACRAGDPHGDFPAICD